MKEIKITAIENIKIGQVEDSKALTGATAIICKKGMSAGYEVRGGGPASRDVGVLDPYTNDIKIHCLLFSGGSAYGLDAAGGVMQYLEEQGVGYDAGSAIVPIVTQSCIYDLGIGDSHVRPDKAMGYAAAKAAEGNNYKDGWFGAGAGATVGKFDGIPFCMKSGIGSYAVQIGDFKLGAIAVVNAYGDIFDYDTGEELAGHLSKDLKSFENTEELMYKKTDCVENRFTGNTTLVAVITNGKFSNLELNKMARMAQNGYARTIRPLHTSVDGDTSFALSVGEIKADLDMAGTLAAMAAGKAISRAVKGAVPAAKYQSK